MATPEFDRSACQMRLSEGADRMGITLSESQQGQLLDYLALMSKWNKAYNLTAVRDPVEMVGRHLLDSLVLLPYLKGNNCLDMGTGPGLPGIPLAIMRPDIRFTLLDSNSKKVRFLRQVVLELGLDHCEPVHSRIEGYQAEHPFEVITARALTSLPKLLELSRALRSDESELLAMKGRVPELEIEEIKAAYDCTIIPLQVAFTEGERCLLRVRRVVSETPLTSDTAL
ncbi:MAG: 16S rRNA (guanine(527)-N(7))-methyltransferase RsmG [Candidatus Thiodiazotropha sp. LLP2]